MLVDCNALMCRAFNTPQKDSKSLLIPFDDHCNSQLFVTNTMEKESKRIFHPVDLYLIFKKSSSTNWIFSLQKSILTKTSLFFLVYLKTQKCLFEVN